MKEHLDKKQRIIEDDEERIRRAAEKFEAKKTQSLKKLDLKNSYIDKIKTQSEELLQKRIAELNQKQVQADERLSKKKQHQELEMKQKQKMDEQKQKYREKVYQNMEEDVKKKKDVRSRIHSYIPFLFSPLTLFMYRSTRRK